MPGVRALRPRGWERVVSDEIEIQLLGAARLRRGGQDVRIEGRRPLALLAVLALSRQVWARDALVALLWPEASQARGRSSLRSTLSGLGRHLGAGSLETSHEEVMLRPSSDHWLDVDDFREGLAAAAAHQHVSLQRCPACQSRLHKALALYKGPLLDGFCLPEAPDLESWLEFQRRELQACADRGLESLVATCSAHPELALVYARQRLALDPLHEPAQRAAMRLLVRLGRRKDACKLYARCRQLMMERLSIFPSQDTELLVQAIRAGSALPPEGRRAPRAAPQLSAATSSRGLSMPRALPPQATPFVGRQEELRLLSERFSEPGCRLVSLLGPGGIGKTRLALRFAALFGPQLSHGACFVPLASVDGPAELLPTLAATLRLGSDPQRPLQAQLEAFLQAREMLLVLDNFEQLQASAPLLRELLERCPRLRLLVTSRVALRLREEWRVELQGLDRGGSMQSAAVQLFLSCARRQSASFQADSMELEAVAAICQRLEGVPLAIELAAGWARLMGCAEILSELERGEGLLQAERSELPSRHRNLDAVFASSWQQLMPADRDALAGLALFRGGFSRDAAEAVAECGLGRLMALSERMLVRRSQPGRFELQELLRQFAVRQQPDLQPPRRARHARWFCAWLRDLQEMFWNEQQTAVLELVEQELPNLRLAWNTALELREPELLAQALPVLGRFLELRGRHEEGLQLLSAAEVCCPAAPPEAAARILRWAACFARLRSQQPLCRHWLARAEALARQSGAAGELAGCLEEAGLLGAGDGQSIDLERLQESLEQFRACGGTAGTARVLGALAANLQARGELAAAHSHLLEAQRIAAELGNPWLQADLEQRLASVAASQGAMEQARAHGRACLLRFRALQDAAGILRASQSLAGLQTDSAARLPLLRETLRQARALADPRRVTRALCDLGACLLELRELPEAASCFDEALAEARASQAPLLEARALAGRAALAHETDAAIALRDFAACFRLLAAHRNAALSFEILTRFAALRRTLDPAEAGHVLCFVAAQEACPQSLRQRARALADGLPAETSPGLEECQDWRDLLAQLADRLQRG